jgi:hypothetical protein
MIDSLKNEKSERLSTLGDQNQSKHNIFVFAIGFESRSIAIFKDYIEDKPNIECVCFLIQDKYADKITDENFKYVVRKSIKPIEVGYGDHEKVINLLTQKIEGLNQDSNTIDIHVDYSSMPRSWYCRLPIEISKYLKSQDKAYFWYSQGKYAKKSESWPSAGVNDVFLFSGKASLRPVNNRSHILGLGFDTLRSQAICTVLDPNFFVVTYSYPSNYDTMRNVLLETNQDIINNSAYSIALPIDDFAFTVSKLVETIRELHSKGDVVLVPDGPKPQVLASSLIPHIFRKSGVFCLHVRRHEQCYKPVNVFSKGIVNGFSLINNKKQESSQSCFR